MNGLGLSGGLIVFCTTLALAAPAAFAREATEAERTALDQRLAAYQTMTQDNDVKGMIDAMPPKIIAEIATMTGTTPDQLRATMAQQIGQVMAQATIEKAELGVDAVRYQELPDGTPYALIPTDTIIAMEGAGRIRQTGETLALLDEGAWYLMRVDDAQQLAILRQAYPNFANVEFTTGTMEMLD